MPSVRSSDCHVQAYTNFRFPDVRIIRYLRQMKLRMKTKFNILSRFGIIGLTIGSLCFAGGAMAQTESKKKSDAAVNSEVATTEEKP